ncbi:PucR family transcriptional regulator [Pseudonocardia endophytica]|uniref:Sugar diacid utilization regulator n=1 Tax=Pseudonocardia endophytica TaxID=401976 RepID=A0A4R1HTC5_PSEEN|nr:helix-turn-helix domain-containing protein [Pseudonocardia endophytica]TCK25917.1 sugar diacid utilization regulator [Pseudonocardia endophytica]
MDRLVTVPAETERRASAVGDRELSRVLDGLAAAVLGGVGAGRLVERLSALLALPVALLDAGLRVRTWAAPPGLRLDSAPSLSPVVRDVPAVRDALAGLGPARPSAVVAPCPAHGVVRRHLVAVLVVDGQPAGYLDVAEMGRALDGSDAVVARQAAAVLSLLDAADLRAARSAARQRDDVVADLLRGSRAGPDLRRLAGQAGLDLDRPHLVVRLPVAPERSAAACRSDVATALAGPGGGVPPNLAEPDAVVVLLELATDAGPPEQRAVHQRLHAAVDAVAACTGVRRAVVSGICRDPADFPAALAETRDVDGIAAALGGRGGVVGVDELTTLRLVVDGGRADVAVRFAERCLGPLRRSDDATGGDLVETLRSYLASGAQVRATAKELGVHENTVRYRLGRIEHVTGLDMRSFDALLAARLAFQVEGLAGG